ncbi:MAG: amidase domain-containing protein [Clostridia bacterium]|nr:amidase domain-containing protein [Clostridia bacterium]
MLIERPYARERALEYAKTWAFDRNPLFFNYTGFGGDCTNFVSQCLFAGSCRMNFTPIYGWYYLDENGRTASWTGVTYLYNFLTQNEGVGPFGFEASENALDVGDVVQLANREGVFYHSLLVSGFDEVRGILVSAHSDDAFDRPLSTYSYAFARYIHISGVRFYLEFSTDACYRDFLSGTAIQP